MSDFASALKAATDFFDEIMRLTEKERQQLFMEGKTLFRKYGYLKEDETNFSDKLFNIIHPFCAFSNNLVMYKLVPTEYIPYVAKLVAGYLMNTLKTDHNLNEEETKRCILFFVGIGGLEYVSTLILPSVGNVAG